METILIFILLFHKLTCSQNFNRKSSFITNIKYSVCCYVLTCILKCISIWSRNSWLLSYLDNFKILFAHLSQFSPTEIRSYHLLDDLNLSRDASSTIKSLLHPHFHLNLPHISINSSYVDNMNKFRALTEIPPGMELQVRTNKTLSLKLLFRKYV